MVEGDKTVVYFSNGIKLNPDLSVKRHEVFECHPLEIDWNNPLPEKDALLLLNGGADYRVCFGSEGMSQRKFVQVFPGTSVNSVGRFCVDTEHWEPTDYPAKLAASIEQVTNQTGLTILM